MTDGSKHDSKKIPLDLLCAESLETLGEVLHFGANKYAPNNWRYGISYTRLIGAILRHIFAIMRGEDNDKETGLSHAAHAMCECMFLVWTMKHRKDLDDRWREE